MTACYITSAFPALLFFAAKYGDNVEELLLRSTNAGGENVARGSLLGALAGAQSGFTGFPTHLRDGLHAASDIHTEAANFVEAFGLSTSVSSSSAASVTAGGEAGSP
jgi:ADP-ribosylglycohydrolase